MKIAAAHDFHAQVAVRALDICPEITWALTDGEGNWTLDPEGSDALVYAGEGYTEAFVDTVTSMSPPRWAHTEDAGTDGRFYDHMRSKGVIVTHSPGANAREVAEFAFAGVLWGAKRLGELGDQQRAHQWDKLRLAGLSAATILVIGLGAIGSQVVKYAGAFGMTVLGIRRSLEPVPGVERQGTLADLSAFLPEADFVVLAVPNTEETAGLFDRHEFAAMKTHGNSGQCGPRCAGRCWCPAYGSRIRRHCQCIRGCASDRTVACRQRSLGLPEPVHLSPQCIFHALVRGACRRNLAR